MRMESTALMHRKIVVAVTGASGAVYAEELLQHLADMGLGKEQVGVVFSQNARKVWQYELGTSFDRFPFTCYDIQDFDAPFASGSARFDTMFIVPCSMGMMGRIAQGLSSDLIARAADVMLKERRRLIIAPRESPYNLLHLKNMEQLILAGAVIAPASPHFYSIPTTLTALVQTMVHRWLDIAHLPISAKVYRWQQP